MSSALVERATSESPGPADLSLVPRPRRLPGPKTLLAGIFLVAFAYHWLQSRAHVTPAVFGDELLYSKLAQSLVSGHGFSVRGEPIFFPAPLAVFVQAPAWLIHSTPVAYAVVKALNMAVMTAAVFPAYALARRVVRPSYALLASAAAVAGPLMLYGPYLMSEALAYPVFLLALATMLRAIERPSRRMEAAVVAVSVVAVLTRLQFIVVPVAYLVAAPLAGWLCGERPRAVVRRHALSLGALLALASVPLLTGGAVLGTYRGAALLDYDLGEVLSWSGFTAALLPFAAGLLVVPGAIVGIASLARRPRSRADAGFAALAFTSAVLILLEVGLIAAGEAERALERYTIYLVPLVVVAFFAYAERGAPWRRLYVALALLGASSAWLMPFPAKAGTAFTFDTPTFSVYGQLAGWWGSDNAASVFAGLPLLGGIALALLPLRRRRAPLAVGLATIAVLLASGISAYAGDHQMTRGALLHRAGDPPDWLDRSGLGSADYLQLPGGSAHSGWLLETWNRSFRRAIQLELPNDGFASATGRIDPRGRLLVNGRAPGAGVLVVNDFGTAIDLEGEVVARPRDGLTVYRLPAAPHVRSLGMGLWFDRWAAALASYQVWPRARSPRGFYRVALALPEGLDARSVTLAVDGGGTRTLWVGPGERKRVRMPVSGNPLPVLRIRTDRADFVGGGGPDARLVAVRIPAISYVPKRPEN
ncbi:MAG TPA: glycosyltransferase family 39 protein [Gaiellaceae bacterium]|jgi:hypothetical protein|nr:glycosyltransferase family 39 protein [Gaiellaceae bacterium]